MPSPNRGRKYVNPNDAPLTPTPLTTAGPQEWHPWALDLRHQGYTVRGVARELGLSFGRVQRFLNPQSKRDQKIRQAERDKERRHNDPEYADKSRDYVRRYMQHRAPERWKD